MPAREVREETLELNVTAEILQSVRQRRSGWAAFWIGMTQYQEAKNGIDALLVNRPGEHFALQFKSPRPTRPDQDPYRYSINDRQHQNLARLARRSPDAVFYVFPAFNTLARVQRESPNLSGHSWLLRVHDAAGLAPSASGRHTVDLHEAQSRAMIHSETHEASVVTLKDTFATTGGPLASLQGGISNEAMLSWLDGVFSDERSGHAIGQRLRGFRSLFIPDEGDT